MFGLFKKGNGKQEENQKNPDPSKIVLSIAELEEQARNGDREALEMLESLPKDGSYPICGASKRPCAAANVCPTSLAGREGKISSPFGMLARMVSIMDAMDAIDALGDGDELDVFDLLDDNEEQGFDGSNKSWW